MEGFVLAVNMLYEIAFLTCCSFESGLSRDITVKIGAAKLTMNFYWRRPSDEHDRPCSISVYRAANFLDEESKGHARFSSC